jgi:hypothetical protein
MNHQYHLQHKDKRLTKKIQNKKGILITNQIFSVEIKDAVNRICAQYAFNKR